MSTTNGQLLQYQESLAYMRGLCATDGSLRVRLLAFVPFLPSSHSLSPAFRCTSRVNLGADIGTEAKEKCFEVFPPRIWKADGERIKAWVLHRSLGWLVDHVGRCHVLPSSLCPFALHFDRHLTTSPSEQFCSQYLRSSWGPCPIIWSEDIAAPSPVCVYTRTACVGTDNLLMKTIIESNFRRTRIITEKISRPQYECPGALSVERCYNAPATFAHHTYLQPTPVQPRSSSKVLSRRHMNMMTERA
jgi:hypothetical protein